MLAVLDDVEIAAGFVPGDLILEAPKLRWFQQWAAGADWLLRYPEAAEREFVLTNVSGISAIPSPMAAAIFRSRPPVQRRCSVIRQ